MKDSGYAEFADEDAAREFLKSAGPVVEVEGAAVQVKKAKTKVAKQRDWALYTALDKLKEAALGKIVEIVRDRGRRSVTVDSAEAFLQEKHDTKGSFKGDFAHFSLPS